MLRRNAHHLSISQDVGTRFAAKHRVSVTSTTGPQEVDTIEPWLRYLPRARWPAHARTEYLHSPAVSSIYVAYMSACATAFEFFAAQLHKAANRLCRRSASLCCRLESGWFLLL